MIFPLYVGRTRAAILQQAAAVTFKAERDQAIRPTVRAEDAIHICLAICGVARALVSAMQADFAPTTRALSAGALGAAP